MKKRSHMLALWFLEFNIGGKLGNRRGSFTKYGPLTVRVTRVWSRLGDDAFPRIQGPSLLEPVHSMDLEKDRPQAGARTLVKAESSPNRRPNH